MEEVFATPAATSTEPLLERTAEVARIERLLDATRAGSGDVLLVAGPAGIGKTRLLAEARRSGAARGLACLTARGGELERDFSFGVVRQLLEGPVSRLRWRERADVLRGAAAAGRAALGLATDAGPAPDAFATTHGLYWVAANLAERQPLALLVDDAHWGDSASLRFLAYLRRRLEGMPVCAIVAARPPWSGADEVLGSFAALDETLTPAPLGRDSIARLLAESVGEARAASLVEVCHEATGGNPFLCVTFAAALGAAGDERAGPKILAAVVRARGGDVLQRIGSLPRAAENLARAVAVLGTEAALHDAATLAGLDEEATAAQSNRLAAVGVLKPGLPFEFVHPLVREAVREAIPGAERALLHGRAARLLAVREAPPEQVAAHLLATEAASRPWVVEALRRAATSARNAGDAHAAATYLARALREPPGIELRGGILKDLALAELEAGRPDVAAGHLADAVARADDPGMRARLSRDLAAALAATGRYAEAVDALEAAIEGLGEAEPELVMSLEADLFQSAMMDPTLYRGASVRVARLARGVTGASPGERALLATFATEDCLATAPADRVVASAARAFDRGLLRDQGLHTSLWGNAAFPLAFADGLVEAGAVACAALGETRRAHSLVGAVRAHTVLATIGLREGALPQAEADARAALELGREAGLRVAAIALGVLVEVLVHRGAREDAAAALSEAGRDGEIPGGFLESWVLHARGWLRLAEGRPREAAADFETLTRRGHDSWRPWNPGIFACGSGLALALARLGQRDRALDAARSELVLSRRWGTPRAVGVSLRTAGLLQGGNAGLALLRESVRTLEGSAARLEHASSLVALGAAIRRAGLRTESREPLSAGLEAAARCGAVALAASAREELVAAGARPRRAHRSGVEALTASELRVARLAADGLSNREIAETLFITMRTVQLHLTGAYRKLGITGRAGLAAALEADA